MKTWKSIVLMSVLAIGATMTMNSLSFAEENTSTDQASVSSDSDWCRHHWCRHHHRHWMESATVASDEVSADVDASDEITDLLDDGPTGEASTPAHRHHHHHMAFKFGVCVGQELAKANVILTMPQPGQPRTPPTPAIQAAFKKAMATCKALFPARHHDGHHPHPTPGNAGGGHLE